VREGRGIFNRGLRGLNAGSRQTARNAKGDNATAEGAENAEGELLPRIARMTRMECGPRPKGTGGRERPNEREKGKGQELFPLVRPFSSKRLILRTQDPASLSRPWA
jgi:hypothetical protein